MAGVCTWLDRDKLPGRATRLTRLGLGLGLAELEWSGERDSGRAGSDWVDGGDSRRAGLTRSRTGGTAIQDVPLDVP